MFQISFLPFICDEYPEASGWVDRTFESQRAAILWLKLNSERIDCVWFANCGERVDLAAFLESEVMYYA